MQEHLPHGSSALTVPRFYLTGRQPLRPGAILLAIVVAAGALSSVLLALGHAGQARPGFGGAGAARPATVAGAQDKDDPDQIDTIVLGDPADAPVPGRRGEHVSPIHPTIVVHLPRFGEQVGLIPDSAAGHLLYDWLAAFNKANGSGLAGVLPNAGGEAAVALQMELREASGGFSLLSAKEVQPGVIVFRLRDQTAAGGEVLGTLQVAAGSSPAVVGSFSLRGVSPARKAAPSTEGKGEASANAGSLRE
jgi:hypothetical protein